MKTIWRATGSVSQKYGPIAGGTAALTAGALLIALLAPRAAIAEEPRAIDPETQESWLIARLQQMAGFSPVFPLDGPEDGSQSAPWRSNTEKHDLNRDGTPEYIVMGDNCGSGGCDFAVMHQQDTHWKILFSDYGDVQILETRHQGWADISVSNRLGAAEYETTEYQFNGTDYRPAICTTLSYENGDSEPTATQVSCRQR